MPRPKKPDLPIEPEHDYLEGPTALQAIGKLSLANEEHASQNNDRKARCIHLDPRFIAELATAAEVDPNRLHAQPSEILLRIIEALSPPDAVALALTSHLFMEVVPWALQKPFKMICSKPEEEDTHASNKQWRLDWHVWEVQQKQLMVIQDDYRRLFLQNLRGHFGATYIYCGIPDKPAVRNILPLRDFQKHVREHLTCFCGSSLWLREMDLGRVTRLGSRKH